MSNSPSTQTRSVERAFDSATTWVEGAQTAATNVSEVLVGAARALSFWTAVAAPLFYPPLLYRGEGWLLVGLLLLHVVALLGGHGYEYDHA
ncbi:hypothetical protein [Halorussus halophilus]|uniref:hypothetical protein n=1 Tax=Halorussus halophilus TaxID=2650975 RepID=UPI001300E92B|nr:hypothetical protein [Halorussus halophilus]